ncbi:putative toxin-antitoxin system toxin component, PIN family [Rhodoferax antarcticus]|uniref:putative toxin-antitoxin system toxin component, PIN family n=1 Tax=Rhodoferax antarcticus TaxID=81479 RepID=UPI002224CE8C|nr:putative toxin-antitoxin system toxin component, PIN family [Rhodoferax antarcticus]MCW2312349.1 putative PIN family toxin of toxin-antitoxin system [Rhodoferax antarcticus]
MCSDPTFPDPAFPRLVLDTNIVLDLFLFHDPATRALQCAMEQGQLQWVATAPMREELARVLGYGAIGKCLAQQAVVAEQVLAAFDAQAQIVAVAPKASVTCQDPDDQKFIDLAVTHQATLLSKDKAVLCMKKRLLALDVKASVAIDSIVI